MVSSPVEGDVKVSGQDFQRLEVPMEGKGAKVWQLDHTHVKGRF